jgi:thiamine biosynthesis protein ThiS
MKITVNGQVKDLPPGETLTVLVNRFCKEPGHAIAEVNGAIIDRAAWTKTSLRENDRIELVAFVGGG